MKSLVHFVLITVVCLLESSVFSADTSKEVKANESPRTAFDLRVEVEKWKKTLPLENASAKLVDNFGKGDASLSGTRNFRAVLHGVYYRGGANNAYNQKKVRGNRNPLPEEGLKQLCEKGFSRAYYYYSKNFSSAQKATECQVNGVPHQLEYVQKTATNVQTHAPLLKEIYRRIKGEISGPIYGHCWNGWHASGLIAALALEQFCQWTPDQALKYWIENTDGNSQSFNYNQIKKEIRSFQKLPDLEISEEERKLICPLRT